MNIWLRELRANFKSSLIWSVVIVVFIISGMLEFSSYAGNEDMLALLDSFPAAFLDAFKFNSFNLTTVTGYFGMMSQYYMLILAIHAFLIGNSIISKEEKDKTAEYSLALPVKRSTFVIYKLLAAYTYCILLTAVTAAVSLAAALKYLPEDDFLIFLGLCSLSFILMQLIFVSTGFLLACAMKRYKRSGYIGVTIVLASYFLSMLIDLNKNLDFLKYITPFKYFDPVHILNNLSLDMLYAAASLVFSGICVMAARTAYSKRDLYI